MMNTNKYWDYKRDDYSHRPSILFQDEHIHYILDNCNHIIDLGCGNGVLVEKLRKNYPSKIIDGLTYNPDEYEYARHNRNIELILGDMHSIPRQKEQYDGFIMWDSLEHCQSAYIALCEAKRVLIEGGRGLIFMPGQNWLDCHCHITCYTVLQMEQLFKQAGLKLISVFKKVYPQNLEIYCDGMAIYEVQKDSNFRAVFQF